MWDTQTAHWVLRPNHSHTHTYRLPTHFTDCHLSWMITEHNSMELNSSCFNEHRVWLARVLLLSLFLQISSTHHRFYQFGRHLRTAAPREPEAKGSGWPMRSREGVRRPPPLSNQHGGFSISRRGRSRGGVTASFKRDSAVKKRELEARSILSDRPLVLVNLPTVAWTSQSDLPTLIVWRESESTLRFAFRCDARGGFPATSGSGAHGATRSIPRGKIHFTCCGKPRFWGLNALCIFSPKMTTEAHYNISEVYSQALTIYC